MPKGRKKSLTRKFTSPCSRIGYSFVWIDYIEDIRYRNLKFQSSEANDDFILFLNIRRKNYLYQREWLPINSSSIWLNFKKKSVDLVPRSSSTLFVLFLFSSLQLQCDFYKTSIFHACLFIVLKLSKETVFNYPMCSVPNL